MKRSSEIPPAWAQDRSTSNTRAPTSCRRRSTQSAPPRCCAATTATTTSRRWPSSATTTPSWTSTSGLLKSWKRDFDFDFSNLTDFTFAVFSLTDGGKETNNDLPKSVEEDIRWVIIFKLAPFFCYWTSGLQKKFKCLASDAPMLFFVILCKFLRKKSGKKISGIPALRIHLFWRPAELTPKSQGWKGNGDSFVWFCGLCFFFFMSRCHFPSDACSSCAKRMTSSADSLSSIWASFCRLYDYFGDEGEWKNVCLKALIYDNMQSQIKRDATQGL